ncbi:MAG: Cof-type HAD-IIB family hydrolase [Oscillospiraceae bacterium]
MAFDKIVFFDIDGTLWDTHNTIPGSTRKALSELRKHGHGRFICSGRTTGFIRDPGLLSLGFDGIVAGCGTYLELAGKTLMLKEIPADIAEYTINTVREYGIKPILEGSEYLYMDEEEFGDDAYARKVRKDMGKNLRRISDSWGKWRISKISLETGGCDRDSCFEKLGSYYEFIIHNDRVTELVPKGYSKGTGLREMCTELGMQPSSSYAFGDGMNDLSMFEAAGTGICMGSGSDEAKKHADYVTTGLFEDGVYNACVHFGLI